MNKPIRVLLIGHTGFLLTEIIKNNKNNNFIFIKNKYRTYDKKILNYKNIDEIWHFGQPSENKLYSNDIIKKTKKGMLNVIKLAKKINAKLVFASSEAVFYDNNKYSYIKKWCQSKIIKKLDRFAILYIPRVYGINKKSGIFLKIRQDYNQQINYIDTIEFVDIDNFIIDFNIKIKKNNLFIFFNDYKEVHSIYYIKKLYIKDIV